MLIQNVGGRQVIPGKSEINSCRKPKPSAGEFKEDLEKSVKLNELSETLGIKGSYLLQSLKNKAPVHLLRTTADTFQRSRLLVFASNWYQNGTAPARLSPRLREWPRGDQRGQEASADTRGTRLGQQEKPLGTLPRVFSTAARRKWGLPITDPQHAGHSLHGIQRFLPNPTFDLRTNSEEAEGK